MSWVCGSVHCQPWGDGGQASAEATTTEYRSVRAAATAALGDRTIVGGHAQFCRGKDVVLIDGAVNLPRGLGRGNGYADKKPDKKPDGTFKYQLMAGPPSE